MTTLTKHALKKIEELGDKAPEYFGKKASTIAIWVKTGKVPSDAIEKVYAENPLMPSGRDVEEGKQRTAINDSENLQRIEALATNANQGVQQIVNHVNTILAPEIKKVQGDQANSAIALQALTEKIEKMLRTVPTSQEHAPTLGQLMNTQGRVISTPRQFERDPQTKLVRPRAQTLASFTETVGPNGAVTSQHPLDSGIAPTADQIRQQDAIRAAGGDPALIGTNRPAGPATQPASANYRNWTEPAQR